MAGAVLTKSVTSCLRNEGRTRAGSQRNQVAVASVHANTSTIGRLALWPEAHRIPDAPCDPEDREAAVAFLTDVAHDPALFEAIGLSSPTLAETIGDLSTLRSIKPLKLWRACLATLGYLSRARHRSTPFGLFAGVCQVHIGDEPEISVGAKHAKFARVDAGWLAGLVRVLRIDPSVLPSLRFVANDQCAEIDGRFVLATPSENSTKASAAHERSIRRTTATTTALAEAGTPISYAELTETLMSKFPGVNPSTIRDAIVGLVHQEFLLTNLQPAATAGDGLAHVIKLLPVAHPIRAQLLDLETSLAEYMETGIGQGRSALRSAISKATSLHPTTNAIQVDVRVDADITVPRRIVADLQATAAALWDVHPTLGVAEYASSQALQSYREKVVERYGIGRLVPLRQLLNPVTGLGAPEHYRSGSPTGSPGTTRRDQRLLSLAQEATWEGKREIVLDDPVIDSLSASSVELPIRRGMTEACVEVMAEDANDLQTGDYRLVLTGGYGLRLGALFGRFLHVTPELTDELSHRIQRTVTDGASDAVPAQVVAPPDNPRAANLTRTPRLSQAIISIGGSDVFDQAEASVRVLDDIAISAGGDRLIVHCLRTGLELRPYAAHALNPSMLPDAARLLLDIAAERSPMIPLWSWGAAAEVLTYLPRVRHGRTIVSNARWRPDPSLVSGRVDWDEWIIRWHSWACRWKVPDIVYLAAGDQRIRVDVRRAADLRLLHAQLLKNPASVIQEMPAGGEFSTRWLGRAHEIAFCLNMTAEPQPEKPAAKSRARRDAITAVHAPGGEWLSLHLLCPQELQDRILARHLPELVDEARNLIDRWFFVRYSEDGHDSLRIRFHGAPSDLHSKLLLDAHDWLASLRAAHLADEMMVGTYRPELGRYGGPSAIQVAEKAFAADSEFALKFAVLTWDQQLVLPPAVLAAASHLDLVKTLTPHTWKRWLLDAYPHDENRYRQLQTQRRQAIQLAGPATDWSAIESLPGGADLTSAWNDRRQGIATYGQLIRDMTAAGSLDSTGLEFTSLAHLSHNRHFGTDRELERSSYTILQSIAKTSLNREERGQ